MACWNRRESKPWTSEKEFTSSPNFGPGSVNISHYCAADPPLQVNSMLRKSEPTPSMSQKFLTTLLSASMTAFLLGGLVSYWATNKFRPAVNSGVIGVPAGPDAKRKPRGPQAQLVRVGTVQRASIVPVKTLVGDLIAVRRAMIATEVAGKLVALPVDEGSKVVAGKTLLARIDDTWTNLEANKIASQIAEKKATLKFEQTDLKRFEDLLRKNAVSVSEVEQKRSLIEGLEASLAQLNVLLAEANERTSRLDIFAPFDGSVIAKQAEIGEYLPIGSPIAEIVSTGRIDARMMVPEKSLPLLEIGDAVDVIVDGLAMELQGKVFSINAQGSVGSRTFPVRVALDDQDGRLLPGMGVSVFVPVMRESTELLVPRDAVLMKPDESTIWILQAGDTTGVEGSQRSKWIAQPIPVRVLSHTRDAYAIASVREVDQDRLHAGVQVVTEGLERLVPGAVVRVDTDDSPLVAVPGTHRTGQQVVERQN